MELRQPGTATSVDLHPSTHLSQCSHLLVGLDVKPARDSGVGSEDLVYGGIRLWQDFANCLGIKYSGAFAASHDPRTTRYAQSVCEACTVRDECETYAIHTGQNSGVWGGDEINRLKIKRAARLRTSRLGLAKAAGVSSGTTS